MRSRHLWVFPVCCQILVRISDVLFMEIFKGLFARPQLSARVYPALKPGPVCFNLRHKEKILQIFHNCEFFPSRYLFPSIITHIKCTAVDSCSLSRYIHVYLTCHFTWLFQYPPIPWVWEEGKTGMFIWCLPKSRSSWLTISHRLLSRVEFIHWHDREGWWPQFTAG